MLTLRLTGRLLGGRTDAGPEGLRNRLITRASETAWADVAEIIVVPGLFGRYARVTRTNGKAITLAVPREGLLVRDAGMDASLETMRALAAANGTRLPAVRTVRAAGRRALFILLLVLAAVLSAALGAPWLEPWWPTRHEATKLPRSCDILDARVRDRLAPGWVPSQEDRSGGGRSSNSDCTVKGTATELELQLALERRAAFESGTRIAADRFTVDSPRLSGGSSWVPVPGLGDRALRTTSAFHGTNSVRLLVRRHNVLVQVDYSARRPTAQLTAEADALARTALGRIPDSH